MPFWKIVIHGSDLLPVQGIGLRESAQKIALDFGIKGNIRNISKSQNVEFVVSVETEEKINAFLEKLKNEIKQKSGIQILDQNIDKFAENQLEKWFPISNELKIEWADDLKEMAWALQGAKLQFELLTKRTVIAEKKRQHSRLLGLQTEFKKMQALFAVDKLDEEKLQNIPRYHLQDFSIEAFDSDLHKTCNELESALAEIEIKTKKRQSAVNHVDESRSLLVNAQKRITALLDQLDKELTELRSQ